MFLPRHSNALEIRDLWEYYYLSERIHCNSQAESFTHCFKDQPLLAKYAVTNGLLFKY